MISKRINFVIEKMVYTGQWDLIALLKSLKKRDYYEYAVLHPRHTNKLRHIDLKLIKDILLRRRLLEFLIYSADVLEISPFTFFDSRMNYFKMIVENVLNGKDYDCKSFVALNENVFTNIKCNKNIMRVFRNMFFKFYQDLEFRENKFNGDLLYLRYYNLSADRIYGKSFKTINFAGIRNPVTKELVKEYIDYCLTNTGLAIATLHGRMATYKMIFNLSDKSVCEWTAGDVDNIMFKFMQMYETQSTRVSRYIDLNCFMEYLLLHDYINRNYFQKYKLKIGSAKYNYKLNSVDNYVLAQIFRNLDKLQNEIVLLIFLLIYTVGMRISEACCMQSDCLERTKQGCFVRYYSMKMKKDVTNVIPLSLYDRIDKFRKTRIGKEFLFSVWHDRPIQVSYFGHVMREFIKQNNIRDTNGELYHFKAHSYRHLMAVRMRKEKIPAVYIQEQLHHHDIDMTLAYMEIVDHAVLKKMNTFIDADGKSADLGIVENNLEERAEYMRKHISAQILPNGICARPIKLGVCPHGNNCLSCPEYRTSKKDLPTHRLHLQRVNQYIDDAQNNGWLPQVESNKLIRAKLEKIIERLEEIDD